MIFRSLTLNLLPVKAKVLAEGKTPAYPIRLGVAEGKTPAYPIPAEGGTPIPPIESGEGRVLAENCTPTHHIGLGVSKKGRREMGLFG